MRLACAILWFLLPVAAEASFGGVPCRADFGCHFVVWGMWIGMIWGMPGSAALFAVLHWFFCNEERQKGNQLVIGAVLGVFAFQIAAACAALMASWDKNPMVGLVPALAVLAACSVAYVRSPPRDAESGAAAESKGP